MLFFHWRRRSIASSPSRPRCTDWSSGPVGTSSSRATGERASVRFSPCARTRCLSQTLASRRPRPASMSEWRAVRKSCWTDPMSRFTTRRFGPRRRARSTIGACECGGTMRVDDRRAAARTRGLREPRCGRFQPAYLHVSAIRVRKNLFARPGARTTPSADESADDHPRPQFRLCSPGGGARQHDPAVATRYSAAASGVSVSQNDPASTQPLRLQFSELDSPAPAAVLGLDPIKDREDHAALSGLLAAGQKGRALFSGLDALLQSDNPDVRQLGLRAANLGVLNWSTSTAARTVPGRRTGRAHLTMSGGDLGSLDSITEQRASPKPCSRLCGEIAPIGSPA